MSLKVENKEHNMALLTFEVAAEKFEEAMQEAYLKRKNSISVPGFRKGKVPRQMIEKMYGAEIFYEDAANHIIPIAYEEELADSDLEVVSRPKIDVAQIEKGKPFIFTAEVALKPEVTLGEYKGIEVKKVSCEVSDEEIETEVNRQKEMNARTVNVEGRPVQNGDEAVIDFEGFVDGVPFEGGKGENYPLEIGSGTFIPGFEEQLVGANIGDDVEVKVTFPKDYQAEELKGKEAVFKCKIHEIKGKEYPELDDEFAQEVSEFDTLAEYKDDIKAKLAKKKEEDAKRAKEDEVVDKIIENAQMDIPDAMIDTQVNQMAEDFAQRLKAQGMKLEDYFRFTGMTPDKYIAEIRPQAIKRIQTRLVLEAVAAAEKIEVSEEKYSEELKKMASMYQVEVSQIEGMLGDEQKEQIRADIAVQEAVTLVSEAAKEV